MEIFKVVNGTLRNHLIIVTNPVMHLSWLNVKEKKGNDGKKYLLKNWISNILPLTDEHVQNKRNLSVNLFLAT